MKLTQQIMGMPITVEVLGSNAAETAIHRVFDYFRQADKVFSTYKPDSEISRLNRGELSAADASPEVREVLAECVRLKALTDGYFDAQRDSIIDPSGYVKGWAVYKAARLLDQRFVTRYCINAGGDMQISGDGPSGGPWVVGITNPFELDKFAKTLMLKNIAVATSGTYERGRHIYNPRTGELVDDPVSLTVTGAKIDRVDALATAAFCMGSAGLEFLLEQHCEAMMIFRDKQVLLTPGFRRLTSP